MPANRGESSLDLYWIPLGAGAPFVAWNGRVYESHAARKSHRRPQPLFHSALEVHLEARRFTIEQAPVWSLRAPDRGVVAEGPVGTARLGRFRAFRYEVRCWSDGLIPDAAEAVGGPVRLSADPAIAAEILDRVRTVPRLTWGRDELRLGEMWNSNSVVSWLLASTGVETEALHPPGGGRAPGWDTGVRLAARQRATGGLLPVGPAAER